MNTKLLQNSSRSSFRWKPESNNRNAHRQKFLDCSVKIGDNKLDTFRDSPDITIKSSQKRVTIYSKKIEKLIHKILSLENVTLNKQSQITICLVNDNCIKKLNRQYLHKNSPTDVLCFDLSDTKGLKNMTADIIISTDTAIRNSKIFKTTPMYELFLYITHGVLHLLGYDDKTQKQRNAMHKRSLEILDTLTTNH